MPKRSNAELTLIDDLAERAAAHGPQAAVARCRELLDSNELPRDRTRGDVLIHLGEYCELNADVGGAEQAYRAAVASGDVTLLDARCFLASWAFRHGDRQEAEALLAEIRAGRPTDLMVYHFIGEVCAQDGNLAAATRWFTAGLLRAIDADAPEFVVRMLLVARRRVRMAQGLTADQYDEWALDGGRDRSDPDSD